MPASSHPATAVKGDLATPPNPWDLVAGRNEGPLLPTGARTGEFAGFWLANVKKVEKGEFTLEWFDWPEYPAVQEPAEERRASCTLSSAWTGK